MKILFVPGGCAPFHGKTLEERPLGGLETAVIRLASALDRCGHSVFVASRFENPPLTKPLYVPMQALADVGAVDVLIAVRELLPLFAGIRARAAFFWTGDSHDQLQHLGLGDRRVIRTLSALLAVSNWQADRLCAISGYPRDRVIILRNGHEQSLFSGTEPRHPKRLVYSSTPYRGLTLLPGIFTDIRAEHPDAELHVFSGMKVYDGAGSHNDAMAARFKPLLDKISEIPGATVHGNVLQSTLARELMKSSILAYPNIFDETSCIAAIEAMAAGCPVITSRRGALPETVSDAGVFIDGDPSSREYRKSFARVVSNLLHDQAALAALRERAFARSAATSWDAIARTFSERLRELFTASAAQAAPAAPDHR